MKDNLITIAFIVIAVFMVYSFLNDKSDEFKALEKQNTDITLRLDSLQSIVASTKDTIKIIEQHKHYITNKYYEISTKIDSVNNRDSLVMYIRGQLSKLGSARFDFP